MYSRDLAYIHDAGFGDFAKSVAPEIARILRRAGVAGGRVVEFGCGSGTLAAYLDARGYDVSGFDISPAMIRLARKNAPGVRFSVASLGSARLPACDAVVGVGEVVTYLPVGPRTLRRFFTRVHAALRPGGVFVFDFMESARRRTYDTKAISGKDWTIEVSASFSDSTSRLTRSMTTTRRIAGGARRSRETHHVRICNRREIRSVLRRCGFEVVMGQSYGRHRLLPGDVAVIARKRQPL